MLITAAWGYTPNLVARGLRMQATKVIALVIADIENPFFTSVCRGVEDAARRHDFSVMLCNTDESVTKEAGYLEILAAQSVAGFIISAASSTSSVSTLTNRGISFVAIGRKLGPEIDCVRSDSHAGARNATRHLLEYGAHRVACVTGPHGVATAEERLEGYREAIESGRLTLDPELIEYANFREDGSYRATRRMPGLANPPDASFVANNRHSTRPEDGKTEATRTRPLTQREPDQARSATPDFGQSRPVGGDFGVGCCQVGVGGF